MGGWRGGFFSKLYLIIYIKATVVSVCVGSAEKILPVIAYSLWS